MKKLSAVCKAQRVASHKQKRGTRNSWRVENSAATNWNANVRSRFRRSNESRVFWCCRIQSASRPKCGNCDLTWTEAIAMQVVIDFERAQGRQVYDVHEKNLGYDVTSLDLNSGELRLIEVKGLSAASGTILLTPNERRVAEDRRDCYWLYIVTNCAIMPTLQAPIKDPARFPWHEVVKVQHYWLEVDAMTQPLKLGEGHAPYA